VPFPWPVGPRGDRSGPSVHNFPDRTVVEVGEVAEKQHETLSLRQRSDRVPDPVVWLGGVGRRHVRRLRSISAHYPSIASRVDDGAPGEGFDRAAPPDTAPASHDADERILHGVRTQLFPRR
jgi:hypothetical protein